jgi:hypothetical protein
MPIDRAYGADCAHVNYGDSAQESLIAASELGDVLYCRRSNMHDAMSYTFVSLPGRLLKKFEFDRADPMSDGLDRIAYIL